jgi:D-alanyl-D-alanine carboxypeptidase
MTRVLAAVLLVVGLLLDAGRVRADDAYAEKAAELVRAYVEAGRFSGAVLVAVDGVPLFRRGAGFANREWAVPNQPNTKFRIGSITKQFTSAAVLLLAERGRLAIDDPIVTHYAEAPPTWAKVTLRHLLSMRSGIPSLSDTPGFWERWSKTHRTPAEAIGLIKDAPLRFEPGSKYEYSNSNHTILGLVIERVSGQTYEAFLRENILDPLGMGDTGLDHNDAVLPRRASGYDLERGRWRNADFVSMTIPFAAGALYSTVDDLLKWDQALYGEALLSAGSLEAMFTNHGGGYGLGWYVGNWLGNRVHTHSGGINGFHAIFCRYPDDRLTVIVLANLYEAPVAWIANELASLHFGPLKTLGHVCHEAY